MRQCSLLGIPALTGIFLALPLLAAELSPSDIGVRKLADEPSTTTFSPQPSQKNAVAEPSQAVVSDTEMQLKAMITALSAASPFTPAIHELAIRHRNPQAFVSGKLRNGVSLLVPTGADYEAVLYLSGRAPAAELPTAAEQPTTPPAEKPEAPLKDQERWIRFP
jgi:hypothetical protein